MSVAARTLLVLGGARSGKSAFAQAQAEASGRDLRYIATAHAFDDEMRTRIARHVAERDARWSTVEAPYHLAEALAAHGAADRLLLVDCLTLWLTNVMLAGRNPDAETRALAAALPGLAGPVILVSNEVGFGIVPDNALARAFRDAQGRLNQSMAGSCSRVDFVVAGLPLRLKPQAPERR